MNEAAAPARRPPWKNPWILGGLLGMAIVTVLRPILRHVPEPPPIGASLPAVRLGGPGSELVVPDDLTGRVHVLALVEAECSTGTCGRVLAGVVGVSQRHAEERLPADILVLALGEGAVAPIEVQLRRLEADPARVRVLDGSSGGACVLARAAFAELAADGTVACDALVSVAHAARAALVDDRGRLRGLYATSDLGLDELRHRAEHVVREAGLPPETGAAP